MTNLIAKFRQDQSGATAIEYGLIAALIAITLIFSLSDIGLKLNKKFEGINNTLNQGPQIAANRQP